MSMAKLELGINKNLFIFKKKLYLIIRIIAGFLKHMNMFAITSIFHLNLKNLLKVMVKYIPGDYLIVVNYLMVIQKSNNQFQKSY